MSVESGVDPVPVEHVAGSASLWFATKAARIQLSAQNSSGTTTVLALRIGENFYEGSNPADLAAHQQSLFRLAQDDPQQLPEIQAVGLDPFQLLDLSSAVIWPDSAVVEKPQVTTDTTGPHIEYEVTVNLNTLAGHFPIPDGVWLSVMARELPGKPIGDHACS